MTTSAPICGLSLTETSVAAHDLWLLTQGLYSMIYYICDQIALQLVSQKGSASDLWSSTKDWWNRLSPFLLDLEEQQIRRHSQFHGGFFRKTLQEWISGNEYGLTSTFKWPRLSEIGILAFRSQVLAHLNPSFKPYHSSNFFFGSDPVLAPNAPSLTFSLLMAQQKALLYCLTTNAMQLLLWMLDYKGLM